MVSEKFSRPHNWGPHWFSTSEPAIRWVRWIKTSERVEDLNFHLTILEGKRVLVVDDQVGFQDAASFQFESMGCIPMTANNGREGFERFRNNELDLILSDIRMPEWDGAKFLQEVRKISPIPFALMTGFADLTHFEALDMGCDVYLGKPLDIKKLPQNIARILTNVEDLWAQEIDRSLIRHHLVIEEESFPKNSCFQLGKRGFFIGSQYLPCLDELEEYEKISFELAIQDNGLEKICGIGRVLWVRGDDSLLIPGCGIEFEFLEDHCRHAVIEKTQIDSLLKRVPKGEDLDC